jgi:RNA polymerase sigma-70 factor (ECF subfamily)
MTVVSEPIEVSLETLVHQFQADVWRYLRYLGASAADADDLAQETFLAVARSAFQERSPEQTAGYLRTVARHQLLMARRRQGREVNTVQLEAAEEVWSASVGSAGMDGYLAALSDCLEHLDGRGRQAIDQCYRDRKSRAEIAQNLQMKPDGVKSLLRRTREILRQCIEGRMKHEPTKVVP